MIEYSHYDPKSVYCRKTGTKIACCEAGKQAWYQNGSGPRTPVFAVDVLGKAVWVDRDALERLRRDSKTVGVVFQTRRGFVEADQFEGTVGYRQMPCGGRVRVVNVGGRWVRERILARTAYFAVPIVVDQTAE